MSSIIQKECIVFDIDTYDKNEAILTLVKKLKEQEKITSIDNFYQDVLDREKVAQQQLVTILVYLMVEQIM